MNIYCDIGNTNYKLLIEDELINLNNEEELKILDNYHFEAIYYSSVEKKKKKLFLEQLKNFKSKVYCIDSYLDKYQKIDFSEVSGIGIDRMLGVIGASIFSDPPFIVIDFGTCTTINFVDINWKFKSGLIMPGIGTQLNSLRSINPILNTDLENQSTIPDGANTTDSVFLGVIFSTIGGIDKFIHHISFNENSKYSTKVLIQGGWAEFIYPFITIENIRLYNNLNLYGMKFLVEKLKMT